MQIFTAFVLLEMGYTFAMAHFVSFFKCVVFSSELSDHKDLWNCGEVCILCPQHLRGFSWQGCNEVE